MPSKGMFFAVLSEYCTWLLAEGETNGGTIWQKPSSGKDN
jgi:hypothetical protein